MAVVAMMVGSLIALMATPVFYAGFDLTVWQAIALYLLASLFIIPAFAVGSQPKLIDR